MNDDLPPLPEPKYIYHRSDKPGEDDLFEFDLHGAVDTDSEGRICQGCERLYAADQVEEIRRAAVLAERERSPWKAALDQELVSLHLGTTDTPGYDTPKAALDAIIQWHVKIALDPAVSSDAAALIAAERERCAKVCESKYAPADDGWLTGYAVCAKDCADAIRGSEDVNNKRDAEFTAFMQRDETLEDLSIAVSNYQESLRRAREANSWWARLKRLLRSIWK